MQLLKTFGVSDKLGQLGVLAVSHITTMGLLFALFLVFLITYPIFKLQNWISRQARRDERPEARTVARSVGIRKGSRVVGTILNVLATKWQTRQFQHFRYGHPPAKKKPFSSVRLKSSDVS
jgi:hypothetical protein